MDQCALLLPDELGEKGQTEFSNFCSGIGLICNEAQRDRTGWDFYVQSKFEAEGHNNELDKRCLPISCFVQVKSMYVGSTAIKLKLSTVEYLLKEPKPAFIYVLKYCKTSNPTPQTVTLIHLEGAVLDKILKSSSIGTKIQSPY